MADRFYNVCVNGQNVIDWANSLGKGYCSFHLYIPVNGSMRKIAQVEVVVDEDGEYNGYSNKWTNFMLFSDKEEDLNLLIDYLASLFGSSHNVYDVSIWDETVPEDCNPETHLYSQKLYGGGCCD